MYIGSCNRKTKESVIDLTNETSSTKSSLKRKLFSSTTDRSKLKKNCRNKQEPSESEEVPTSELVELELEERKMALKERAVKARATEAEARKLEAEAEALEIANKKSRSL
jgi:hypothetical protein